jgi:hypothetical protein
MGARRVAYWILVEKLKRKRHLKELGLDGKNILKRIFKKWDREAWTGLIWLRILNIWRGLVKAVKNFCVS